MSQKIIRIKKNQGKKFPSLDVFNVQKNKYSPCNLTFCVVNWMQFMRSLMEKAFFFISVLL